MSNPKPAAPTAPATAFEREVAYVRELPDVNARVFLRNVASAAVKLAQAQARLKAAEEALRFETEALHALCADNYTQEEIEAARATAEAFFNESLPHLRETLEFAAKYGFG